MKKIRMICAALTIAAIGTFGSVAFAADTQPQNAEPVVGGETTVIQKEVAAHMQSGYAEVTVEYWHGYAVCEQQNRQRGEAGRY